MTDETVIERRLAQARGELKFLKKYEYAIVNDDLETATMEMRAIVLTKRNELEDGLSELAVSCSTAKPSERLKAALASFESA